MPEYETHGAREDEGDGLRGWVERVDVKDGLRGWIEEIKREDGKDGRQLMR